MSKKVMYYLYIIKYIYTPFQLIDTSCVYVELQMGFKSYRCFSLPPTMPISKMH